MPARATITKEDEERVVVESKKRILRFLEENWLTLANNIDIRESPYIMDGSERTIAKEFVRCMPKGEVRVIFELKIHTGEWRDNV